MPYNYKIAVESLSEGDKDRFLCVYLNTTNGVTDWKKATADFGSASVDSMKVSLRNAYKKIEKAGGKLDDDGTAPATPATPATNTKGTGKKRKAAEEVEVGDATVKGELEDEPQTPAPKKRAAGRPKKVTSAKKTKEVKDEVAEDDE